MVYFTDGPIKRTSRDITEFDSSAGQVFEASLKQAIFENPTVALMRMDEMDSALKGEGELIRVTPGTKGAEIIREPDTPLLTFEEADAKIKESGLDLKVPQEGIRERALNILIQRNREESKRQFILSQAPSSSAPISLLGYFAGSALDPLNLAAAFIPIVGQARYSAMLANATSKAARLKVRAGVGALEGAVGTAALEPLMLMASAQDQTDYDMTDSLLNIAFGTVLGGGLHSIGGLVSDARRARVLRDDPTPLDEVVPVEELSARVSPTARNQEPDNLVLTLQGIMDRQIQSDQVLLAKAAYGKAVEELTPEFKAELKGVIAGRTDSARDLKQELSSIDNKLNQLDDSFKTRAKEFQKEGKSRKQAEKAAREAIQEERMHLNDRKAEVDAALTMNREAELAAADMASLNRGEIPERYRSKVQEKAAEISKGFDKKPVSSFVQMSARQMAESAPWQTRQDALKTAIAQAMSGRDVDVQAHFDALTDPQKAIDSVSKPQQRSVDPLAKSNSEQADEMLKSVKDDVVEMQQSAANDQQLAQDMADQQGIKVDTTEADELVKKAEIYTKAWKAAAVCMVRN